MPIFAHFRHFFSSLAFQTLHHLNFNASGIQTLFKIIPICRKTYHPCIHHSLVAELNEMLEAKLKQKFGGQTKAYVGGQTKAYVEGQTEACWRPYWSIDWKPNWSICWRPYCSIFWGLSKVMLEAILRVAAGPAEILMKAQLKDCCRPCWKIPGGQAKGLVEVFKVTSLFQY